MASSSSRIASFERPATWALSSSAARLCLSTNLSVEMSLFMTPGMEPAAEILRRHDGAQPEANITSTVRDFLILRGVFSLQV